MQTSLNIVAIATAATGHEATLRNAQAELVAATVKETGCVRFELSQSLDDPRIMIFTETWATERDWRAHMEGAAIKRFQASGAGRLIQDFSLFRLGLVADGSN